MYGATKGATSSRLPPTAPPPDDGTDPPPPPYSSMAGGNDEGWEEAYTDEGQLYYINHQLRRTRWELPSSQSRRTSTEPAYIIAEAVAIQPTETVEAHSEPLLPTRVDLSRHSHSAYFTCEQCSFAGMSRVKYEAGPCTWLSCFGLMWVCPGCCWLPFCMSSLLDVHHICPSCRVSLGTCKRLS
ncbi:unnamed protein product [Chrysoparadoxa australica]